ncbi:ACT domain-containing protein [Caldivirga maquilingensis]|uniref:Amino acid-binding ACT domain protein n=1 Tax=Caldivirga maquilingensis (strain ATCC 700844 / DSM 13496 / JCM 10307 / IC-167) TaxID=397948 RepID=A8MBZ1_CALMQ|nr:ACT domain-containing protein [Caldivirga maquilingensis]ABW01334.1 amino acid-binding ACT domain protein [Caldivirga maquilingensis IC-167]
MEPRSEPLSSVLSEVGNVFGHVYRSILSSPSGVFIFFITLLNRPGALARLAAALAELGLNLTLAYLYTINEELAMALLIYEAKEGYFQKAIEELRKGGAVVREAYEVKVTERH